MSSSSGSSASSRSDSSSSACSDHIRSKNGSSTRHRTRRLPNTWAINCMKYFTGRNPAKITGVRVYETTWPEPDYETGSLRSALSRNGGGKRKETKIVLLESKHSDYWDDDDYNSDSEEDVAMPRRAPSRMTQRSNETGFSRPAMPPQPMNTYAAMPDPVSHAPPGAFQSFQPNPAGPPGGFDGFGGFGNHAIPPTYPSAHVMSPPPPASPMPFRPPPHFARS